VFWGLAYSKLTVTVVYIEFLDSMTEGTFRRFLNGFVAACELLHRAAKEHCLVEYICLAASVIDANLRIALILQHQLATSSAEVLNGLLYQAEEDEIITERTIYKRALEQQVIDAAIFAKLEELYARRNRVIHRYVISDITTLEVLEIASGYERIIPVINKITSDLEERQEKLQIGMLGSGELGAALSKLSNMSGEKHANEHLVSIFKSRT
jgi:uncharacterized protein YutE (UPF0331/DUF86 family)